MKATSGAPSTMEEDEAPPERKGRKGAGKRSDSSGAGAGSVAKPKAKPKGSADADVERNLLLD